MPLESAILRYGYGALLVGTALEGETILVVAGYLAHRGYLHLPYVVGVAALGTFIGDQSYFQIGRHSGKAYLARHPHWQKRADRVQQLLDRHRIALVVGFRFMYGIRTVSPFIIGISGFPRNLFMLLNATSAAVWAVSIGGAGYMFGHVLEHWLETAKSFELPVIVCMLGVGIATWFWLWWHARRAMR